MAFYLVRAKPIEERLPDLRSLIDRGEVRAMSPFGNSLDHSLRNARRETLDTAVWEELDYCSPPLKQERAAVLDHYFTEIAVEVVESGEGWKQIDDLPSLWNS